MGLFKKITNKIKEDKLIYSLLIIVIILGLFLRFNDFSNIGYWDDDESAVPAGILWYYPHSFFPGLAGNSEPQLGNILIGLGCLTSGEDFSGISNIQPGYYPGRSGLIGKELVNSNINCHIPMYLFGLFLFIAVILLSLVLFDKYSSLYIISFFAFSPFVLRYSRWIHTDILMWAFVIIGYYFLYKGFITEKYLKKEKLFFILTFSSFSLATVTKLTGAPFIIFAFIILLIKYKEETLSLLKGDKIRKEDIVKFLPILVPSFIISLIIILLPFKLNIKNITDMLDSIKRIHNPYHSGISLHFDLYNQVYDFFLNLNVIDMIIALFSIFIIYKIITKKRTKQEEFILYSLIFYIISIFLFNSLELYRLAFPYMFSLVFLMGLTFSENEYSLINLITKNKKRIVFGLIIIVYIIYSFSIVYSTSPYFIQKNPIKCKLTKCEPVGEELLPFSAKDISYELNNLMKDNETFFPGRGMIYYYTRENDDVYDYAFFTDFQRQVGKKPGIADYVNYYRPNGRFPRYLILDPYYNEIFGDEERLIKENIKPKVVVKVMDKEIIYIYDVYEFIRIER